ncbi:hypothetical protein TRFO_15822 [Tritrichomonas foetus]|uniref:Uncharacterized protein n=1 Tax=Tritrichomonas foetus TaxID=1144522 RepID=A0A1J4KW56_9EUKA|nr:hypothetical protein TRFO_15822 [Tritrichomonas foetus]|eukprot:OHT13926.1 hypothetical protein TRFO_15822 [Tritrichomonas foetus]
MTFVFSPPRLLDSPHKKAIIDAVFYNKSNLSAYISPDRISIWNMQNSDPILVATISSHAPHHFLKGAFIDNSTFAVLTSTNRIYLISLKTFAISENFINISIQSGISVVFFQKVGKHIFVMTENCNIFYINFTLTKIRAREIKIESKIIKAQSTNESLFLLLESGQIANMKLNDFNYLALPTATNFCVDKHDNYIHVKTSSNLQKQWQLWSLPDLTFIQIVENSDDSNLALFSPVSVSCCFFTNNETNNSLKLSHYSKIISQTPLFEQNSNLVVDFPVFDSYGQILMYTSNYSSNTSNSSNSTSSSTTNNSSHNTSNISSNNSTNNLKVKGNKIYYIGFATASSAYSDSLSAPITSSQVLLPLKDTLFPVKLPEYKRGRLALFGETALAVATDSSILILPFSDKICPSVSDGAAHSQFIKNTHVLKSFSSESTNEINTNKAIIQEKIKKTPWLELAIDKVKSFSWSSNILICLSSNQIHTIVFRTNFDINNGSPEIKTITVKGRPLGLSSSGNKLLVTFASQLSFYSIDQQKLISTTSLGKTTTIKSAHFLSSETVATLTADRRLLLIYHSKVHRSFEDCLGMQLTGSNAWPLFMIGERWRLLGANYSELDFDSTIEKALMVGVDGFSIICLSPFQTIEFVHLVVCQSLAEDSMASAVSILSQLSEERRLKILQKVGCKVTHKTFDTFMSLVDRYTEIEDRVLASLFNHQNKLKAKAQLTQSILKNDSNESTKEDHDTKNDQKSTKKTITNNTNNNNLPFDKKSNLVNPTEFFKMCFARGWYLTAAELIQSVGRNEAIQLLVKSEFNINVVNRFFEQFKIEDLREVEDEITNYYRLKFVRNDFIQIAELLPYFECSMKRFLLRTRRERESNQDTRFSVIIEQMRRCSRQQLIDLAAAFEETNSIDLVFCCNYVVKNFAKCVECIERQQRMMKFIDTETLIEIGYL